MRRPALNTVLRRWRFRRNLAIYLAHRGGMSTRQLADVHDLAQSRVVEILEEFRELEIVGRKNRSVAIEPSAERYTRWGADRLLKRDRRRRGG